MTDTAAPSSDATPVDGSARPPLPPPPPVPSGSGAGAPAERSADDDGADGTGVPYAGWRLAALIAALVLLGLWNAWVLIVIVAIVAMITLHELGHFLTAKRAGMKVTEFFIFFGPKVWSIRRGETEYGIKCIPAGAYVRIIGMHNLEEVAPADEARTYRQKPFWSRFSVAVAGSTMHFLLALALIFVALVVVGQPSGTLDPAVQARNWSIESIVPGSGAEAAGLEPGDRITRIDGEPIGSFDDLRDVATDHRAQTVDVEYLRDGDRHTVPVTLAPFYSWYLDRVVPGSGLDRAGLRPGDQITSIAGTPTTHRDDLDDLLAANEGRTVPVTYERGDDTRTVDVDLESMVLAGSEGFVGIARSPVTDEKLGVVEGLVHTPGEFVNVTSLSIEALGRFFSPEGLSDFAGQVGSASEDRAAGGRAPEADSPPVTTPASNDSSSTLVSAGVGPSENRVISVLGLVQIGSEVGSVDPGALIALFALVNIFIGVFNLIPLLPFDGGHVAIAVYEKVQEARLRRRRYFTDVGRLMPLTYVVVALMGLLFVSTLYLDIANPLVAR